MNCIHRFSLIVPALLLAACGGSSKTPDAPATPAGESAAKAEPKPESTDVTTKSETAKPKAQEQAAAESSEPECSKDKDCTIFADCCTCKAVAAAGKPPVPCDSVCGESKCETKGKTIDNVACVAGHCKLK